MSDAALTPEQQEKIEVASIRLKLAVEANDAEKAMEIVNGLDSWTSQGLLTGLAWLVFGGK